jgi:hypothetical protein
MKKCTICKELKAEFEFNKKPSNKDGLQTKCRLCSSSLAKSRYYANAEAERDRVQKRKDELTERFQEYKTGLKCQNPKCHESDPCCLEFHHLNPNTKDFDLASAARQGYSWDRLMKEVDKCAVLCSNCHRKLHSGRWSLIV